MTPPRETARWLARLVAALLVASLLAANTAWAQDDDDDDGDDDDDDAPIVIVDDPVVAPQPTAVPVPTGVPFDDDGYRRGAFDPRTIPILDADPDEGRDGYLEGELIVRLAEGGSIDDLNARLGTFTFAVTGPAPFYLLKVPLGFELEETAAALADDPAIEWADLNYLEQAPEGRPGYFFVSSEPSPDLPSADAAGQLDAIDAAGCATGAGAIVAVLDTGVDATHPDLAGRIAGTPVNILDGTLDTADVANGTDDDGDGLVDEVSGHGTHVAGVVARVAPEAGILPVRVLNSDGVGDAFFLAAGIIYAAEQGADVINLSLSSSRDARVVREAVAFAHGEGSLVVAAAGNADSSEPEYPAAYEDVVSVAAVDDRERRAGFSNYGETIDLAAPGVDIWSAAVGGGYVRWSGTSMATPFVSAAAAQVAGTDGAWPPARLTRRLVDTAVDLPAGRRGESDLTRLHAARAARCE